MISLALTTRALFFPKQPDELNFKSAMKAHKLQDIAWITKTALYALASVAATFTLFSIEAAAITWSIAAPVIAATAILGLLFYRINSLNERYVAGFDETTKPAIIKQELATLFQSKEEQSLKRIVKTLHGVNRLLGTELFDDHDIAKIRQLALIKQEGQLPESLAEIAHLCDIDLSINKSHDWVEKGRYGLNNYECSYAVAWDGKQDSPIDVIWKRKPEEDPRGAPEPEPINELTETTAS